MSVRRYLIQSFRARMIANEVTHTPTHAADTLSPGDMHDRFENLMIREFPGFTRVQFER